MSTNKSWIVAKIKPSQDKIAFLNLGRQEFDFFQPNFKTVSKSRNQFREIIKPVFPGYIFIAVNLEDDKWPRINNTRGISNIISFGNQVPIISCKLIKELKYRFSPDDINKEHHSLKIGMNIKINNGPFAELVAKIDEINSDRRVWILLNILGSQTRVSIKSFDLRNF